MHNDVAVQEPVSRAFRDPHKRRCVAAANALCKSKSPRIRSVYRVTRTSSSAIHAEVETVEVEWMRGLRRVDDAQANGIADGVRKALRVGPRSAVDVPHDFWIARWQSPPGEETAKHENAIAIRRDAPRIDDHRAEQQSRIERDATYRVRPGPVVVCARRPDRETDLACFSRHNAQNGVDGASSRRSRIQTVNAER